MGSWLFHTCRCGINLVLSWNLTCTIVGCLLITITTIESTQRWCKCLFKIGRHLQLWLSGYNSKISQIWSMPSRYLDLPSSRRKNSFLTIDNDHRLGLRSLCSQNRFALCIRFSGKWQAHVLCTVDSLITHTSHNAYSLITHVFGGYQTLISHQNGSLITHNPS